MNPGPKELLITAGLLLFMSAALYIGFLYARAPIGAEWDIRALGKMGTLWVVTTTAAGLGGGLAIRPLYPWRSYLGCAAVVSLCFAIVLAGLIFP